MKPLQAKDVLNHRVIAVEADRHPAEIIEWKPPEAGVGGRTTHVAVFDAGRFCGLVGVKELTECPPGRIFVDLASKGSLLRIGAATPIEEVCAALERAHQEAAAVVDEAGVYLGAVTLGDLKPRLADEQYALAQLTSRLAKFSIDHAADPIFWVTADAKIHYANGAACRMLGYTREELLGMSMADLDLNHSCETWASDWEEFRRRGSFTFESRHIAKGGRVVDTEVSINHMLHEGREFNCAMMRDITERRRAETTAEQREAELLANKRQLREMIDGCFGFIGLYDLEGTLIEANRAPLEAGGLSREEVIGRPFWEAYWWSFSPEVQATLRDALRRAAAGETVRYETPVRVKGDGRIMIDATFGPLRGPDGRVTGIVGFGVDVTERKRSESALRTEQSLISAILDNAGALVVVLDAEGRICRFNRAAEVLSGYSRSEVEGRTPWETVLPNEASETIRIEAFASLMDGSRGEAGYHTNEWVSKSGERRLIEWSNTILRDADGHPEFMVSIGVDITARERAHAALRQSESRLKAILDSEPECVKLVDAECRLVDMNASGLQMVEADSISTVRGRSVLDLIDPRYHEQYRADVTDVFGGGKVLRTFEAVGLRGTRRWLEQHSIGLRDPNSPDRVELMLAVTRDITERKNTEHALRKSEARLSEAHRLAGLGAWELDLASRMAWWSPEQYELSGVEPGSPISQPLFRSLIHPEDRAAFKDGFKRLLSAGSAEAEYRIVRPDGAVRHMSCIATLHRDAQGRPVWIRGTNLDITERKQAEHAIRENESRLLEAQRIAKLGSWELDIPSGRLRWSDSIFELFEIDKREFTPTYEAFLDVIHPDDRDAVNIAYTRSVESRTPYDIVHRLRMPDGRVKHMSERCETFYDEQGRPVRSVGTVQDISERTRLEAERARAAQREALATLAGGIAHEFNSTLLAAGIYLRDAAVADVASLTKAAALIQQAQSLSASLLELFVGPEIVAPPILAIGAWLPGCIDRLADLLPPGATVSIGPFSEIKPVLADPLAIEQVLRILLTNASDAIAGRGEIRIDLAPGRSDSNSGPCVEVRVIDEGPGVPAGDRHRIFDPFFTTKSRARRSGLGLALAARLAEQAGGRLFYEPNSPKGSMFVVRLQVADLETAS